MYHFKQLCRQERYETKMSEKEKKSKFVLPTSPNHIKRIYKDYGIMRKLSLNLETDGCA